MHPKPRQCPVLLFALVHILRLVQSQGTHCTVQQFKQNQRYYDDNFEISNLAESYPDQQSVRVGCKVGYSGFFKMTCSRDQWTYKGNKCQPRSCGHPGDAQFADFQLTVGQDFVFGSQVEYTCHKGFLMANRRNFRRCMAQGWDGVIPICEPLQCPAIYPDSNVLVQGDTENSIYRNSVQFSCRYNNQILSGQQEIICNEHGEWSGTVPKCIEIKCGLPDIPNGSILGDAIEYKENDFLHYECDDRYQRIENRLSKCTNLGLKADWSPVPHCEIIKCRLQLTAEDQATYVPPNKNVFLSGEMLSIHCGQNYWIGSKQNTSVETRCQDDGTWTVYPICRDDFCTNQRPRSVSWWYVQQEHQIRLRHRTQYGCRSGYVNTAKSGMAECTRDGWSPNPLCREILCDPIQIDNAVLSKHNNRTYRNGQSISYGCKEGYEGNPLRTCSVNGWSGSSKCTAKGCPLKGIADAQLKQPSKPIYTNGTNLQYVCNKNGNTITVTCVLGKWEGMRECSGCGKAHLENGFVVKRNANTIHFRCNEGYRLSTHISWVVATCRDGHWIGFSGQCIDNTTCGKPPVIPNGRLTDGQHVNKEDSTVAVICEEGFMAQVQNFTCTKGEWSSFGKPLTDICKSDATYCGIPPKIENTVVISSEKLFPPNSEVTYQCRHKFTLEGDGRSVCVNGQWDVKNFACTEIKGGGPNIPNVVGDEHMYQLRIFSAYSCSITYNPQ
ncbi:complement factor H-like [Nelusetta ayraudi]|uniref:complement factor H-like n=1 Tax=Nelusetta ayraudi TaxID=303726 RepID=UPI003F706441